jgi:hypothetical protein
VVGLLQYRRIPRRNKELEESGRDPPPTSSSALAAYESLPLRAISRMIGFLAEERTIIFIINSFNVITDNVSNLPSLGLWISII